VKVIVSCSGKFHAFNLVEQLQKQGVDVVFFTSYSSIKNRFFKFFVSRRDLEEIQPKTIKTNIFVAIGLKLFPMNSQLCNDLFDLWVSRRIKNINADVFIGWSCMSERSIRIAKSKNIMTILERGSAHIEVQDSLLNEAYKFIGKEFKINSNTIRKELLEYKLADFISIPSRFCKRTFLEKGINGSKLFENTYGVSSFFKPILKSNSSKTTFLYLGKLSIQKGIHLLLPIIELFIDNNEDFEFRFIGAIEKEIDSLITEKIRNSEKVKFYGHINHYSLNQEIGWCDVAIIPSIQDGFAMVAVQIFKVGLPIIVSSNAGAEQLVKNGQNGWVIAPQQNEIKKIMHYCIRNTIKLKEMRLQIVNESSAEMTWEQYGSRYIDFLNSVQCLKK
jgi:glycosyltransferase involved in cell wall biosynthesis